MRVPEELIAFQRDFPSSIDMLNVLIELSNNISKLIMDPNGHINKLAINLDLIVVHGHDILFKFVLDFSSVERSRCVVRFRHGQF